MNTQQENRAVETVEKHNCRFSTVPTAPTAADNQIEEQPTETTDDRLHKMLDATWFRRGFETGDVSRAMEAFKLDYGAL